MKKFFFLFFRIIITFAIFFAVFKFVPYKRIVDVYKDSNKIYLLWGLFLFFCSYLTGVARWKFLLSALGIKISYREAFYSFFCGLFFNLFFPSFVAGDVFRGYAISYRHGDAGKVASSILMDRYTGAIALITVSLSACFFYGSLLREKQVIFSLAFLCVAAAFASLVIFNRTFFSFLTHFFKKESSLKKKLISFHDQLYFFKKNPRIFLKSLGISLIVQIITPLGFFAASKAFGIEVPLVSFMILVPLIMAIALIPITIAGAGTREASAVYFFSLIGVDKSIGLGMSLLNLVFLVLSGIVGGFFYVVIYHRWLQSDPQSTKP